MLGKRRLSLFATVRFSVQAGCLCRAGMIFLRSWCLEPSLGPLGAFFGVTWGQKKQKTGKNYFFINIMFLGRF